jgi:hypothetical protein
LIKALSAASIWRSSPRHLPDGVAGAISGRILGVIGTRAKRIPLMIAISVINAFLAMLLMRIIL